MEIIENQTLTPTVDGSQMLVAIGYSSNLRDRNNEKDHPKLFWEGSPMVKLVIEQKRDKESKRLLWALCVERESIA